MPTVTYEGRGIECEAGANLRQVLREAGIEPYNGPMRYANCRGLGTCGTCAVDVDGPVSDPTGVENWRLSVPPHDPDSGLRLACQIRVEGDVDVTKHGGLWGHERDETATDGG